MEPLVSIVMGSDSDLGVMQKAAKMLDDFGVPYEMKIISAHRTPDEMNEYARGAKARGIKVIIAGAGWAAALPGMIAAQTTLPVIGVPLYSKMLNGVDALYSIIMTPTGVPVATVAIDGAGNAALLAIRMLSVNDAEICAKLEAYNAKQTAGVNAKSAKLQEIGYAKYLEEKKG